MEFQNHLGMSPSGNYNPTMYGVSRTSVVKLVYQVAGTYNDQYRRPLRTYADGHTLNLVEQALNDSTTLSPTRLANPAMRMLRPDATPESRVDIVNGWGMARLRFLLHMEFEDHAGQITNHYYSGYTEHGGEASLLSGRIDPNMLFTINSVNAVQLTNRRGPGGTVTLHVPIQNSQIFNAPASASNMVTGGIINPSKVWSLRPENVLDDMQAEDLRSQQDTFMDMTTSVSDPVLMPRKNNTAPNYMQSLVGGYRNSLLADPESSHPSHLNNVKGVVGANRFSEDRFLAWLMADRQMNPRMGVGFHQFTLGDLVRLDVGCEARIKPIPADYEHNFHVAGSTAEWGASSLHAQIATIIASALPTYMTKFNLNQVGFTATNLSVDGSIQMTYTRVNAYNSGVNLAPILDAFMENVKTELLANIGDPTLPNFGRMPFELEVRCHLLGETFISISMAEMPYEDFVAPTFCDSVFTAMASNQEGLLHALANDFRGLFELVDNNTTMTHEMGGSLALPSSEMPGRGMNHPQGNVGTGLFDSPSGGLIWNPGQPQAPNTAHAPHGNTFNDHSPFGLGKINF